MFNIPIKNDNSIFVSIASYRDDDTINTIIDCFSKSKNPSKIFIGICQQNKDSDTDTIFNEKYSYIEKYINNIRIIRIPYFEAKGPTYARYLCSSLWNGETYYLQIDSHIRFSENWDELSINMINSIIDTNLSKKPVLSYYSKIIEESDKPEKELNTVPRICESFFNERGIISLKPAQEISSINLQLTKTPYIAAGFIFANSSFLKDVPFDPYLSNLFTGEEILLSTRFWTNGWDIFSPNKNIVFHKYIRKNEPKFWDDNDFDDKEAVKKLKYILGLDDEVNNFKNLELYGLGKVRSLEEYYDYAGIDIKNKKVYKNFCNPTLSKSSTSSTSKSSNYKKLKYKKYILFILLIILIVFLFIAYFKK